MSFILSAQAQNQEARRRLRYSRRWASSLLVLAAVLFVLATLYQPRWPWLGYLKAFAEAAMVGALADWFAVTALFRHPLGIPIPHTAILPRKQARIADELGRFVEHNFLQGKSIALRVYQARPADKLLTWLSVEHNKSLWLPWLNQQIPVLLKAAKPNQVARFGRHLLLTQYSGQKMGETLANGLSMLRQQGLDVYLLRALMQQTRRWLQDANTRVQLEQSLLAWAGKIEQQAPSTWEKIKASLKTTLAERVDDWVAGKALDWADSYLAAALDDDEHKLWQAYALQVDEAMHALRHNPRWHRRLAAGKQQWAESEAMHRTVAEAWRSFCRWSEIDVQQQDSLCQAQLEKILNHMLKQAVAYPAFMRRMDARIAWWVRTVVERYKPQGARFVADKVKSWDSSLMVDKLELAVGRDLQFIRINGTIVGGLAGLLIYTVAQWLLIA